MKSSLVKPKLAELLNLRNIRIALAKKSFWEFCTTLSPEFYKEDRWHLKELANTLQKLIDGELINQETGEVYRNLLIEMPPRHGKSRTLTNFSAWILGKDNENRIITGSYNDDLAQDFSRHTRDIIAEEKNLEDQIVFSDIFPDTKIKHGDASYKKWALEGQFFNYKGTGVGGSITGKGGMVIIIDDPVKDAETAYNELALEKIWLWYSGTLLSRAEEGAVKILCMTPWAKGDLASKLLDIEPEKWFVIRMPAINKNGDMLCSELLSRESYEERKRVADDNIFSANYNLTRLDIRGRLYSTFKTYDCLPDNTEGDIAYCDTADEGDDYLCSIHAKIKGNGIYIVDVLYTQEAQEKTEPMLVDKLDVNKTNIIKVESNNGGRAFSRNIRRMCDDKAIRCSVRWFHQSKNKIARILTNAPLIMEYVYFPANWKELWPGFNDALINYQKTGKNKHDDAPDALTGLVEHFLRKEMHVPDIDVRDLGL